VVGRGDDGFVRNRRPLHHLVFIHNRRQDGVVIYLARGFVVGQCIIAKGIAEEELTVGVRVVLADAHVEKDEVILPVGAWEAATAEQATQQKQ
jgi:hypothetical protein